jgi:hypothetical protein
MTEKNREQILVSVSDAPSVILTGIVRIQALPLL